MIRKGKKDTEKVKPEMSVKDVEVKIEKCWKIEGSNLKVYKVDNKINIEKNGDLYSSLMYIRQIDISVKEAALLIEVLQRAI